MERATTFAKNGRASWAFFSPRKLRRMRAILRGPQPPPPSKAKPPHFCGLRAHVVCSSSGLVSRHVAGPKETRPFGISFRTSGQKPESMAFSLRLEREPLRTCATTWAPAERFSGLLGRFSDSCPSPRKLKPIELPAFSLLQFFREILLKPQMELLAFFWSLLLILWANQVTLRTAGPRAAQRCAWCRTATP